jgi:hypothetical protein
MHSLSTPPGNPNHNDFAGTISTRQDGGSRGGCRQALVILALANPVEPQFFADPKKPMRSTGLQGIIKGRISIAA